MRRIVREAAEDDAAEGSRWLEIQVDPTSYAPFVGGITPALEIVLDEARTVSAQGSVGVGVVVAASRMRHPLEARTLARLAAHHAGEEAGTSSASGCRTTSGAGWSPTSRPAFAIARRAGLALVPHGGELLGAQSVMETLEHLDPDRIGHGVRSRRGPTGARRRRRGRRHARGVPGQQRRPRRLPRPERGAAAPHRRRRGPGGPGRRRPPPLRVPPGGAVCRRA